MAKVLILDANQQPLHPVHISYARMLLSKGKAAVFQRYPFTIILKDALSQPTLEQLGVKTLPKSRTNTTLMTKDRKLSVYFSRFPEKRKQ